MKSRHFRIEKRGGIHWLVSPAGERMFYTSVQCVSPKHGSRVKGAPAYDGVAACGGSLAAWISQTEDRLRDWGFKGLGAWNHRLWRFRDVPYTESLSIWHSLWVGGQLKPVYDPDWEKAVDDVVRPAIERIKGAPALIGYFLDNEIKWNAGWLLTYFDGRLAGDPNRRAVLAFLKRRHRTVGRLNRTWGTKIRSWGALAAMRKLPAPPDGSRADRMAFLEVVARRFFATTSRIVRRHDPYRPILGIRHAGFPPVEVSRAQRGATDVYSINLYVQEGEFPAEKAREAHEATGGQPLWVTEFSWHAPWDNRSGDKNTCGFGSRVRYQRSRGLGYQKFVAGAASLPFVIGTDWFQWCDESPMGRGDGEDVNFGLLDIRNRPYEDLIARVRATNGQVDSIHARARIKPATGVRPAEVPVSAVPSLVRGSVEEAGAPLDGLKFRPGLDPRPARVPVIAKVGWTPSALHVVVDVADSVRTVEVRKPKRTIEWFWMTDAVELLIRPGSEDREALDSAVLKVWAVPDGSGKGRPCAGAFIRHERITARAAGVRVDQHRRPGGYRLEFRIPALRLGKGPLRSWDVLRFNLLVMDCEKVLETCWSSHGGEWTTERPLTWGRLVLCPPG